MGMARREGMVWGADTIAAWYGSGTGGMAWQEGMVWGADTLAACLTTGIKAVLEFQSVSAR
jgi:hypothetical protein